LRQRRSHTKQKSQNLFFHFYRPIPPPVVEK
jgi:hypothetical protein